ncbi:MAG: flavodoxin [Oscillospiraceae bacterium]
MSKILVAYFSASGVTTGVAKALAQSAGADLYEIKPETPYTDADLDWNNKQSRSTVEMNDLAFRPPLADKGANIAAYDVVFVGFPIWWYIAPTLVNTFLESYDFAGKKIIPFATSGGSGFGKTVEKLAPSVSGTAVWQTGKVFRSHADKAALPAWVATLNL